MSQPVDAWKVASVETVWRNEAPSSSALVKSELFTLLSRRGDARVAFPLAPHHVCGKVYLTTLY